MNSEPKRDVNKLMEDAVKQLDEHKAWLAKTIREMPADVGMQGARELLALQAAQVKVRIVNLNSGRVSIVYDYPDELYTFLRSPTTPKELRDSLVGGHEVSSDKPSFTFRRE